MKKPKASPGVDMPGKGTQIGTSTSIEGDFSLDVPDENAVLVFSFVGYQTQEIVVGNQSRIDVSMKIEPPTGSSPPPSAGNRAGPIFL